MSAFIARQPNGRLCRHSTVVDCVTAYNMTDEDYIELCAEKARREARNTIKNHLKPFHMVKTYFFPNNMTREEFDQILKEMTEPYDGEMVEP